MKQPAGLIRLYVLILALPFLVLAPVPILALAMSAQDWVDRGLEISRSAPDSDEEAQCYRKALALDDSHASAHFNLAYVLDVQAARSWRGAETAWDDLEKFYQALGHYAQAASLDPERFAACENVLRITALLHETPTRRPPDLHAIWVSLHICDETGARPGVSWPGQLRSDLRQRIASVEQRLAALKNHLPDQDLVSAPELTQRLRRGFTRGASPYQGPRVPLMIQFDFDSATIKAESKAQLHEMAQALNSQALTGEAIIIEGHADSSGNRDYNQSLSERRARSVKEYLARLGVSPDRLQSKGYGVNRPLVPNDSETNRAMNRRVEFVNMGALESYKAGRMRNEMDVFDLLQ